MWRKSGSDTKVKLVTANIQRPNGAGLTWLDTLYAGIACRVCHPKKNFLQPLFACLITIATLVVAGCSQLPVGGPNHFVIDREASNTVIASPRAVVLDYVVADISRSVLDNVADVGPESFFGTFGTGRGSAPELRLGVGDVLAVSIYESSAGGLFSNGVVGTRTSGYFALPAQAIDHRGTISVPVAGELHAAGKSVAELSREIERKLAKRAIEPQVSIALVEQNATDVSVFGDATGSAKLRIKPGGERILDMIARAGLRVPGYEIFVTLRRKNIRATVYFPTLLRNTAENIYVKPGDIIYVYRDPQRYIAVGALGNTGQTSGLTGQFTFDSERQSLAEGVAKAGGLLDSRAHPSHVFLYRLEYRKVLEKMGLDLSRFHRDETLIPTIYRANYRDPSVFFFASQFPMRNRDIIYVANADSVEAEKFFAYVRLITGTIAGVATDATGTRDAARALAN